MKLSTKLYIGNLIAFAIYIFGCVLLYKSGNYILSGVLLIFISKDMERDIKRLKDEKN